MILGLDKAQTIDRHVVGPPSMFRLKKRVSSGEGSPLLARRKDRSGEPLTMPDN